jgi:hypothetical protein
VGGTAWRTATRCACASRREAGAGLVRGVGRTGAREQREERGEGRRREEEGKGRKRKGRERKEKKEKGRKRKEKEKERKMGKKKRKRRNGGRKKKEREKGKRVTRAGDIRGGDRGWSATRARRSHAARGEKGGGDSGQIRGSGELGLRQKDF